MPSTPSESPRLIRLPVDLLRPFLESLLIKRSLFRYDAQTVVSRMLEADTLGDAAYGCARIVDVLAAIDSGDIDPRGRVLTVTETPALAVLDGSRAAGAVAASKAVELALAKAQEIGLACVAVGNSQPLGSIAVLAQMVAQAGMIGFCVTSTGKASIAAPGTNIPAVGDTRCAWGIPTGPAREPLLFCHSTGHLTWGELALLQKHGLPIPPETFAPSSMTQPSPSAESTSGIESRSSPPPDLASSLLQPAGGLLGFGYGMIHSLLAGPLSGGKTPLHKPRSNTADDSQHFIQVWDIARFVDRDRFQREVNSTLDDLRQLTGHDARQQLSRFNLPGFNRDRLAAGIPLAETDVLALQAWGTKLKLDWPFGELPAESL